MRFGPLTLIVALTALPGGLPPAAAQGTEPLDPALLARLERLVETLDQRRQDEHIPGLAVALVRDGRVVLARGLGVADVETGREVTPETVFAIGSTTKTMTAALVGMGVDAGRLGWDDSPSEHIPGFSFPALGEGEEVTLRDMLSHRTGLTRMPMLWATGEGSFGAILEAVGRAELYAPFRSAWQYNNVMFMMPGHAAANAAGLTWEELVQRDILTPLAMGSSSTDYAAIAQNPAAAKGYLWDAEVGEFDHQPPRRLHLAAPAGAINSTVLDMTAWAKTLLNGGVAPSGARIISGESLEACWSPQIEISPGKHYGLGWMVWEHRGRRVVEHGGNIDGFASTFALMPEEGLAFIMLMNVTSAPLQYAAIPLAMDALLGDEPAASQEEDAARFVGAYLFEALGGDMVVTHADGVLTCAIPGQGETVLEAPDAEGFRAFRVNAAITVRFEEDETGRVVAMEFRQGPAQLRLPKRADDGSIITPGLPFTPEELGRLTGGYRFDDLGVTCTVLVKDAQLHMDVPGQMVYALAWEAAHSRWRFRDHPGITLVFQPAEGPVESIGFTQGGLTVELPRVGANLAVDLPDLDGLLDRRRESLGSGRLAEGLTMRMRATLRVVHQGVIGTVTTHAQGPERHATTVDTSPFGVSHGACMPGRAWSRSTGVPLDEVTGGVYYEQERLGHPWLMSADLRDWFAELAVEAAEPFEGQPAVIVRAKAEHLPAMRFYIDPQTGRTLGVRGQTMLKGLGPLPVTMRFGDWREVDGVWFPFRTESENVATGKSVLTIDTIEFGVDVPDRLFDPEAAQPQPTAEPAHSG